MSYFTEKEIDMYQGAVSYLYTICRTFIVIIGNSDFQ